MLLISEKGIDIIVTAWAEHYVKGCTAMILDRVFGFLDVMY